MKYTYCQSCGRRVHKNTDYGTEADGSLNRNYCIKCYKEGRFTEPNLTRTQMVARIVPIYMEEKKLSYRQALIYANYLVSELRRWQTQHMWN